MLMSFQELTQDHFTLMGMAKISLFQVVLQDLQILLVVWWVIRHY